MAESMKDDLFKRWKIYKHKKHGDKIRWILCIVTAANKRDALKQARKYRRLPRTAVAELE